MNAAANFAMDRAFDASLSEANRREGYAMLRGTAQRGSLVAQQILRQAGDTERFPAPTEGSLTMKLEPRNPAPGTSRACSARIA